MAQGLTDIRWPRVPMWITVVLLLHHLHCKTTLAQPFEDNAPFIQSECGLVRPGEVSALPWEQRPH